MQNYAYSAGSTIETRNNSFRAYMLSGRATTIKKRIITQLYKLNRPVSANELVQLLGVYRHSLCGPLWQLVHADWIRVAHTVFDTRTQRHIVTYELIPDLFSIVSDHQKEGE